MKSKGVETMNEKSWTQWMKFFKDETLKKMPDCPGIYALAISGNDLSGHKFDIIKEIKYFGMTNNANGGLQTRLKQFKDTIEGKTPQHGGAERFLNIYKNGRKKLEKILFISVLPVECDPSSNKANDLRKMGKVCMLEYEYQASYVEKFKGDLPDFNNKKKFKK
jgi:hypothetical protein